MIEMNLDAALVWAKHAEAEDLCGMSAMAARVLAAEVERRKNEDLVEAKAEAWRMKLVREYLGLANDEH